MIRRMLVLTAAIAALAATACAPYSPRHKGGIDPSTGLYTRYDEDLVVFDTMKLALDRTYLSGDRVSRQFGIGGTHLGEWYLIGDGATSQWAELILADGGRIRFTRISSGTSAQNGVFEHRATPTEFLGSRLRWDPRGWLLTFADGATALFNRCHPDKPDVCSILERRDPGGHAIRYVRDASGLLIEMRGDTQAIVFSYDTQRRVSRAEDSGRNRVDYTYDDRGRLVRVTTSAGIVRTYAYSPRDEMITIDEPGWHTENDFDANGRVIRQTMSYPNADGEDTIKFGYTVRDGVVVQTDTTEFDGTHTRMLYNSHHYRTHEILNVDSVSRVTVAFDRDAITNVVRSVNVQCRGGEERRIDMPARRDGPEPGGAALAARACRGAS